MKLLTVLIAPLCLLLFSCIFYLNWFYNLCTYTISLFTLFPFLPPFTFLLPFFLCPSLCPCLLLSWLLAVLRIYILSSLTLHSWAGKTLPIPKYPNQAGHTFSPPKSQNSISLKHTWRLLSRHTMQKAFYEFKDWKRFCTGLHLLMKRRSVSFSGHRHDHRGFLWWERLPLRRYSGGSIGSPQGCHQSCQVRSCYTLHFRHSSWCSYH